MNPRAQIREMATALKEDTFLAGLIAYIPAEMATPDPEAPRSLAAAPAHPEHLYGCQWLGLCCAPAEGAVGRAQHEYTAGPCEDAPSLAPTVVRAKRQDDLRRHLGRTVTLVLLLGLSPVLGQAQDMAWSVRVAFGPALSGDGRTSIITPGTETSTLAVVSPKTVTSVDVATTLTSKLEGAIGLMSLNAPVRFGVGTGNTAGLRLSVVTVGFNVQLKLADQVALYSGPLIAGTSRETASDDLGRQLHVPASWGIGAQVGIRSFTCRDCEGFGADLRLTWLQVRPSTGPSGRLPYPVFLTFGLAYRF